MKGLRQLLSVNSQKSQLNDATAKNERREMVHEDGTCGLGPEMKVVYSRYRIL